MSSVVANGPLGVARQTEELAELAEDQHDGDARDVPDENRLREVVGDPAEAGQAGQEEDDPDQDGEQRRETAYCVVPAAASGAITVAMKSDTVPSGPTTTRGADPKTAYASTGSSRA